MLFKRKKPIVDKTNMDLLYEDIINYIYDVTKNAKADKPKTENYAGIRYKLPVNTKIEEKPELVKEERYDKKLSDRPSDEADDIDISYLMPDTSLSTSNVFHLRQYMIDNLVTETFKEYVDEIINTRGYTDVDVYKRAGLSRQYYNSIMNDKIKIGKAKALALAIGLKLNLDETRHLLELVGYALSNNSKMDLIYSYFIQKQIYDINLINELIFHIERKKH